MKHKEEKMESNQVDIVSYDAEGYSPIIDFQSWRVAVLNYIDELLPNKIDNFQCHRETDEVFVLLSGKCILFCADIDVEGKIVNINSWNMQHHQAYNIKKGVYHTHTLSEDAKVLIIENQDTSDLNSPKIMISEKEQCKLQKITAAHWG